MSHKHGAIVVFGSGPGVGRNVAALFAERGFEKVVLLSRDATRLVQDAEFVRSASSGTSVYEIPVDLGDLQQTEKCLRQVDESLAGTPLECVLFNAARLGKSEFFDFSPAVLERDLRITIVSLYAVTQWAMPKLLKTAETDAKTPSFLVTSGMLGKDPAPPMFSLAACKAGQYNFTHSLHKEFEPKGVHCVVIVIAGKVADASKVTNARNIAEESWNMFSQPKGKGEFELVMMDPAFAEHVKNRQR